MQALRIDRHGPHTDLAPRDVPAPALPPAHVRVEVHAAAVNPSDVGSAEGRFANAPLPRILGRDLAGRVIEGPAEWLGVEVWGTGGDLGITRDGTHAEQIVLPIGGVARRPARLSVEEAAAVGVPFTTAWSALVDAGRVAPGEWVVVSGAAGAVGSAAIEIAAARGARVVALVRDDMEAERLDRTKVAAVATSERGDVVAATRAATGDRGADLALNGVGGVIFQPLLDALADGGRMVVYSTAAGREVPLDLFSLYRRRLQLAGVNTGVLEATDGAHPDRAGAAVRARGAGTAPRDRAPPALGGRHSVRAGRGWRARQDRAGAGRPTLALSGFGPLLPAARVVTEWDLVRRTAPTERHPRAGADHAAVETAHLELATHV